MAKLSYTHIESENRAEDCLPAGEYVVQIIDSEVVPNKKGNGEILKLQLQVIDGQHSGRVIFLQMNVSHENDVAERIGRQELNRIVHAVGLDVLNDSEELHGKPFIARFDVQKQEGYPDKNVLKNAKKYGAAQPKQEPRQERRRELSSDELAEQELDKAAAARVAVAVAGTVVQQKAAQQNGSGRTSRKTPF